MDSADAENGFLSPFHFLPAVFDDALTKYFSDEIRQVVPAALTPNDRASVSSLEEPLVDDTLSFGVQDGTEWWQSFLVILAAVIGVGVLSLPEAFSRLGWIPGVTALMACCGVSIWSGNLFTKLVLAVPHAQVLPDVVEEAFGSRGRFVATILGYVNIIGGVVVYHLTASQSLQQLAADVPFMECQPAAGALFTVMILVPLQAQNMHAVSLLSFIGAATILIAIAVVVVRLVLDGPVEGATTRMVGEMSFQTWPGAITCFVYAFAGQVIFVELISHQREFRSFKKAVWSSSLGSNAVYLLVASVGYAYLGEGVRGSLMSALPVDAGTRVVNTVLFVHVAIGYTIYMTVLVEAVLRLFRRTWNSIRNVKPQKAVRGSGPTHRSTVHPFEWFLMSGLLVSATYALESSIPFFTQLVSLSGALTATPIMTILPALCGLRVLPEKVLVQGVRWQCYIAVLCGSLLTFLGVLGSLLDIVEAYSDESIGVPWACNAQG
jgi:amino acid permease